MRINNVTTPIPLTTVTDVLIKVETYIEEDKHAGYLEGLEKARDVVDCVRFTTDAPEYLGETVEEVAQEMMRQINWYKTQPRIDDNKE